MRIILVDDNNEFRTITAQLLSRAGHVVRPASSAQDAVRLLSEAPADLIVTDIIMPEEDGLELMMRVRRQFPTVAIIAISGSSPHSGLYLKIASKLGAVAALPKPFSVDELLIAIARIELGRATGGRAEG